jgi:hypothetical protein
MTTPIADEFAAIKAELERIKRERLETIQGETPKQWPSYSPSEDTAPSDYVWQAPDDYMG